MPFPRQLTLPLSRGAKEFTPEQIETFVREALSRANCPALVVTTHYKKLGINTWPEVASWIKDHPKEFYNICSQYWLNGSEKEKDYIGMQLKIINSTPEEIL